MTKAATLLQTYIEQLRGHETEDQAEATIRNLHRLAKEYDVMDDI